MSLWTCGTDVFSHTKATYRGSTTSLTAQASHGDTKTRRKVLGRNADVLVGNSTPEQDKYGNSETRLKNASIRGIAFSDVFDKHTNCGSKRTGEFAEKHRNPWIHLAQRSSSYERPALILQQFITDNGVENLHVAGARGSKEAYVCQSVTASYPVGAGLPAASADLSVFECEHMPLYSNPGHVQVTSPAS